MLHTGTAEVPHSERAARAGAAASAVIPPNPKLDLAREQTTSQQARPMRDRLRAWRIEVRSAPTATELARLYSTLG